MKILHVCLASHFTEGLTYQDNFLSDIHAKMEHDVLLISDTNVISGGRIKPAPEEDRLLSNGVRLIRLEFDFILNAFISSKIKKVSGLKSIINNFKPDTILFHGVVGWELLTVASYKRQNPTVKLYVDSHVDFNNSATNRLSYYLQYRLFNNLLVKSVRSVVDKFLYITSESKDFLIECYGLSDDEMEYYPLGGIVFSDQEYVSKREKTRNKHSLSPEDIVFLQTGKFDTKKKLVESLMAFSRTNNENFRFYILGKILPEIQAEVKELIDSDPRISYLGWANAETLADYLCACDVYVQPGSQSATMQMSLCCRCAVVLQDVLSHRDIFCNNGWLINDAEDLVGVLSSIEKDPRQLSYMQENSYDFATDNLDYRKLAQRVLM